MACILSLGLLLSARGSAARGEAVIRKSIEVPVPSSIQVAIDHPMGALVVRGWSRSRVKITALKRGPDLETARRLRVHAQLQPHALSVETRVLLKAALPIGRRLMEKRREIQAALAHLLGKPKPWGDRTRQEIRRLRRELLALYRKAFELSSGTSVEKARAVPIAGTSLKLTVYVPMGSTVEARTERGDIDVADLNGSVTLTARRGRIYARKVVGAVRTRSDKGHQFISTVRGAVEVDAYDGDLRLRRVSGPRIQARVLKGNIGARDVEARLIRLSTTSGGVDVAARLLEKGKLEVRARRGDIVVRLQPGVGFRYRVQCLHGKVDGLPDRGRPCGRLRGRRGAGNALLDLRTAHGGIKVIQ